MEWNLVYSIENHINKEWIYHVKNTLKQLRINLFNSDFSLPNLFKGHIGLCKQINLKKKKNPSTWGVRRVQTSFKGSFLYDLDTIKKQQICSSTITPSKQTLLNDLY